MFQRPIISILHPTARVRSFPSFPGGWKGACEQFGRAAFHPENIEYVLIVHESNWAEFWTEYGGPPPEGNPMQAIPHVGDVFGTFYVVQNHGPNNVVAQINAGAAAASGLLFVGIMDDLEAPIGWDEKLTALLPVGTHSGLTGRDFDGEWVIDLTGEPTPHIVYSALTRARYERYGYVLSPEFESMSADNYYSHMAHQDGVVINGRHLGFQHHHPIFGRAEMDAVYEQQNRPEAYRAGQATFMRLVYGTRVLSICLPGETFPYPVAAGQAVLLNHLNQGNRFIVADHRGHCSNVYVTRIELTEGVLEQIPAADLVLWVDDDNILSPQGFECLLSDLDSNPELDIVVGWCWCDNDGEADAKTGLPKEWMISCGRQKEDLAVAKFTRDEILEARRSGNYLITSEDLKPDYFWSGFPAVLMRAEVLRRLGWEAFKPMLMPKIRRGFTSEDTSFFYCARQLGVKCAVDGRVKVPHVKLRAIEPDYIPESQKPQALAARAIVTEAVPE